MIKWLVIPPAFVIALIAILIGPLALYSPVSHPVESLSPNLWNLKVEFLWKDICPLTSRVVIIRNPDSGDVAVYNPMAGVVDYKQYGKVKYLIVGNGDHVSGIPAVVKEFKNNNNNDNNNINNNINNNEPILIVPPGMNEQFITQLQQNNVTTIIHEIQYSNLQKDFPFLEWKEIEGFDMNEIVIFHTPSQLLIVTDSCVHSDEVEYPGYPFWVIRVVGFFEEVYRMPGVKTSFVNHITNSSLLRASITDICESWKFNGIVMSHGKPFIDKYSKLYWQSAWMQRAFQKDNK